LGIGADELEKGLRLHIRREVHQSLQLKYSDNIAKIAAIQPTPVTEADVHATLGDVFLQMDRKEDAKAELTAALALDDGHGPAHASLGMLDLRDRRWEASRPHFERAVASPSANFLCHYYYGLALSQSGRETGSPNTDDLTAMERAFRRSIELNQDLRMPMPSSPGRLVARWTGPRKPRSSCSRRSSWRPAGKTICSASA
jgi:tetratricopeptide (TPR) repeat protein